MEKADACISKDCLSLPIEARCDDCRRHADLEAEKPVLQWHDDVAWMTISPQA